MLLGKHPVSASGRAPLFPQDRKQFLLDVLADVPDEYDDTTWSQPQQEANAQHRRMAFVAGALWSFGCYSPQDLEVSL